MFTSPAKETFPMESYGVLWSPMESYGVLGQRLLFLLISKYSNKNKVFTNRINNNSSYEMISETK